MVYDPNSAWTTAVAGQVHATVYFLRIAGLTVDYATADVPGAGTTKVVLMEVPKATRASLDVLSGRVTHQQTTVQLLDVAGAITELVATEVAGAPVSTLKNRKATLFGGYRGMTEANYAEIFAGRITSVRLVGLGVYELVLTDAGSLLDGVLCSNATVAAPTVVKGNPINLYHALLSGTFSLAGDFPLDYISSTGVAASSTSTYTGDAGFTSPDNALTSVNTFATGETGDGLVIHFAAGTESGRVTVLAVAVTGSAELTYSIDDGATWTSFGEVSGGDLTEYTLPVLFDAAMDQLQIAVRVVDSSSEVRVHLVDMKQTAPSGLAVPASSLDETHLQLVRDTWRPDDVVRLALTDPADARTFLETEFFRALQCFPGIRGDGNMALQFYVPALPITANPSLDEDDVVQLLSWRRLYAEHLNEFIVRGDFDLDTHEYTALYDTETAADVADRAATGETVTYEVDSMLLHTDLDGEGLADELASRSRLFFLKMPALMELGLTMRKRALEVGDTVVLTHRQIPNLNTGTRGVTEALLLLVGLAPDYRRGLIRATLLDVGWKRYGVLAPAGISDYTSATTAERHRYFFVADVADDELSNGDPGYRYL